MITSMEKVPKTKKVDGEESVSAFGMEYKLWRQQIRNETWKICLWCAAYFKFYVIMVLLCIDINRRLDDKKKGEFLQYGLIVGIMLYLSMWAHMLWNRQRLEIRVDSMCRFPRVKMKVVPVFLISDSSIHNNDAESKTPITETPANTMSTDLIMCILSDDLRRRITCLPVFCYVNFLAYMLIMRYLTWDHQSLQRPSGSYAYVNITSDDIVVGYDQSHQNLTSTVGVREHPLMRSNVGYMLGHGVFTIPLLLFTQTWYTAHDISVDFCSFLRAKTIQYYHTSKSKKESTDDQLHQQVESMQCNDNDDEKIISTGSLPSYCGHCLSDERLEEENAMFRKEFKVWEDERSKLIDMISDA